MKIEELPSRAKWGQAGPNSAKWWQTGSNGAKKGQKVPYGNKHGQKGQRGQTRPNGVLWGWFFACMHISMRFKNHVKQPRPSDKNWPSSGDFDRAPLRRV